MSPHVLVTVTHPFQLSLSPETAFAQSAGSPNLFWYLLWVDCMDTLSVSEHEPQSPQAASRSEKSSSSIDDFVSDEVWCPVLFELPATDPSFRSRVALVGLEGGLTGSYPHCFKLGLSSGTNLGMFCCHEQSCVHS